MSKRDKLIQKIFSGKNITFKDAENILLSLNFEMKVSGSHHNFRRAGYYKTASIKKRPQLRAYQVSDLQEVLKDHGY
jgi:hypothetical protein